MGKLAIIKLCTLVVCIYCSFSVLGLRDVYNADWKLFSSLRCRHALERIEEIRLSEYYRDAALLGIQAPNELQEYIERRKRNRYLSDELQTAYRELDVFETLESSTSDTDYLGMRLDERKAWGAKLGTQLSQTLLPGHYKGQDAFPFLTGVFSSRPPPSLEDLKDYEQMAILRISMSASRSRVSRSFVSLPLTLPVTNQDPATLETLFKAQSQVQDKMSDVWSAIIYEDFPKNRKISDERVYALEESLLQNPDIPDIVKRDIGIEMDFELKYGFSISAVYEAYLRKTAMYFEVRLP